MELSFRVIICLVSGSKTRTWEGWRCRGSFIASIVSEPLAMAKEVGGSMSFWEGENFPGEEEYFVGGEELFDARRWRLRMHGDREYGRRSISRRRSVEENW
jgi:hypothetical protein